MSYSYLTLHIFNISTRSRQTPTKTCGPRLPLRNGDHYGVDYTSVESIAKLNPIITNLWTILAFCPCTDWPGNGLQHPPLTEPWFGLEFEGGGSCHDLIHLPIYICDEEPDNMANSTMDLFCTA